MSRWKAFCRYPSGRPPRNSAMSVALRPLAGFASLVFVTALINQGSPTTLADESLQVELDVPYEPTHEDVVETMLKLGAVTEDDYVVDLGCGDGRVVIMAARKFGARGLGVDLDPQRLREAVDNATYQHVSDRVTFQQMDIMATDIREATVVTLYLLDQVNLALRPRLFAQLKPGTRVVSHAFYMGDWEPDQIVRHPRARNNIIYLWIIPAHAGGIWRSNTPARLGDLGAVLDLQQHFQAISGSLTIAGATPVELTEAILSGDQLTLKTKVSIEGRVNLVTYHGQVRDGVIEGTQEWSGSEVSGVFPWLARRDATHIEGRWWLTAPSYEGMEGILAVHQRDGIYYASWMLPDGLQNAQLLPFYAWGTSVRFDLQNGDKTLIFTGTLANEQGKGILFRVGWPRDHEWSALRLNRPQTESASLVPAMPHSQWPEALVPTPLLREPQPATVPLVPTTAAVEVEAGIFQQVGPNTLSPARAWSPDTGEPQAGDVYTHPADGSVLVWIPGGEFLMGNDAGKNDERPAHRVKVAGFWMGTYEVTNRQYALFLTENKVKKPYFWGREGYSHPDQPVVGVTWTEARAYCDWAGLRLPTELEWEYAATGGQQLRYATANGDIGTTLANARYPDDRQGAEFPHPVGSYPPNPFGLHDLAGNAWEWTMSRFAPYPYNPDDGREDKVNNTLRVLRGGGWCFPPEYCSTTYRHRFASHLRCDYTGIRVALSRGLSHSQAPPIAQSNGSQTR